MVTENVPGCPKHPDFVLLKEEADKHGYVLVCSGIHDVHAVHPIVRERWLGVWCRKALSWAQPHIFAPATALSLASECAILMGLTSVDLQALRPSVEAVEMLSRADLLPSRDGGGKLFNPIHVFEARVRSPHQPMIAAMACYGNQHNLPVNLLKRKGLMTHLLRVDGVVRYYHIWR